MGPAFGPGMMDSMGQGPMGPMGSLDPFMQGAAPFGDPNLGTLGPDTYGPPETGPTEAYFFEDPALYDDYESTRINSDKELQLKNLVQQLHKHKLEHLGVIRFRKLIQLIHGH